MSLHRVWVLLISRTVTVALGVLTALPAISQYPGQVAKSSKDSPELRSIAVLEWTGDLGKPKASRLVPVAVLDGGTLQDGGIYLARPEPLALAGEVEYELDQDGKPVGLFDIKNTGQEQGSWVGYGWWKPMPMERPKQPKLDMAKFDDDAQSDVPVLHRKHHADDAPSGGGTSGGSSGSASSAPAADSDPDRPKLHRAPSSGTSDTSGTNTTQASTTQAGTTTASTTGTGSTSSSSEPTLHRKDSDDSSGTGSTSASSGSGSSGSGASSTTAPDDPDRPVMKRSNKKPPPDVGRVDSLPDNADPDRPRLKRGRSNADNLQVSASLMGLPPDMEQAVAVSDARTHPEHSWDYSWANPDDEGKMKSALEDMARTALGLNPPPAPAAPKKTATARTTTRKTAKPAAPPAPPEPAPLLDEKFRVFELSYGAGATLVLTAHTAGPLAQEKFVTLVAQPDLYGNLLVLLKSVTDGAHLDDTPRMRLVDAVDALADNRGELLFELRGATQRQFALYRVLCGQAEKLFVSGGGEFSMESSE